ncbi:MAG TPA: hypothetical protein PKL16_13935, partial [Anaerolineae bacterium]|nr:hypothetical protein [Anaerolineae bacterium]HQM15491.1 hypothetical protein [Anaerolineae bacterium]
MTDVERVQTELARIEQAIAAVRAALSGPALEVTLASLLEQRATLLAQVHDGASAQGAGAKAVGAQGMLIEGSVNGDVLGPNAQKIVNPDPEQAAAERARERYLRRLQQQCNVLPLAAMGGDEGVGEELSLEKIYVALDTTTRATLTKAEKKERFGREDRPLTA